VKVLSRRSSSRCLGGTFEWAGTGSVVAAALIAVGATAQAQPLPTAGASGRTEIVTYDNWTVTCRDGRDPKEKRICTGELNIVQEANDTRRTVFAWLIGLNKDNAPATAMRFPPGVTIAPGVVLKFADRPPRTVPITTCEPGYCEASMTMDDSFMRDAQGASQAEAAVTASDGRQVMFTVNMKGFTQALAAVRR
jgi:invasion protein IalB